jgi:hypothetical protein
MIAAMTRAAPTTPPHHRSAAPPAISPAVTVNRAWPTGSGVYRGTADPASVRRFNHWRGVPAAFAADYLSTASWTDIAKPTWWLSRWHAAGMPLVLAIPMLPDGSAYSIRAGAHGHYNHYFRALARNLVRFGDASAALRIGWEMNGNWYRWSAQPHPAQWIAYYRNIVRAMRSVPGTKFNFNWNANLGNSGMKADAAYPGNRYVDSIGLDVYDWKWNDPLVTPPARWTYIRQEPFGLNWLAKFGAVHHKPIALPEWSLAKPRENTHGGGGDDPYFVRHFLHWAARHHVEFEAYFDDGRFRLAKFPKAAAVYRRTERALLRR